MNINFDSDKSNYDSIPLSILENENRILKNQVDDYMRFESKEVVKENGEVNGNKCNNNNM